MSEVPRNAPPAATPTTPRQDVIAFLADASCYGPDVGEVAQIETHGAIVYLAGDRAYKLKRAVRLGYLDFSTIGKREAACRHEFERNAPTAPELYLGVEPIVRDADDRLSIGGRGTIVDWVVVMSRFDQGDLLDNLAKRKQLDVSEMVPLARRIADYHAQAGVFDDVDGKEISARVAEQVLGSLRRSASVLPANAVEAYAHKVDRQLQTHADLLRARARNGYVRLCHGDLHLRNIVMHNEEPVLFDAIEFDDTLATTDVLYDLAFLLMDLLHRDLAGHASACLAEYASIAMSEEALGGLAALPLFLSLRAGVRAMVGIDRLVTCGPGEDVPVRDEIQQYFTLANELLETAPPVLIAVGGRSGTGKTTLAKLLAPWIGAPPGALHLRSDVERKRLAGVDPLERLPATAYTDRAADQVYEHICRRARRALEAGCSVIVDAAFLDDTQRAQVSQAALDTRLPFHGIWLDAPYGTLLERVTQRQGDASDADAAVVAAQSSQSAPNAGWHIVDAQGTPETVAVRALQLLRHLGVPVSLSADPMRAQ